VEDDMNAVARALGAWAPALLAVTGVAQAQGRPDVAGMEAAVVADHPLAAAAGAEVLRRGGNAVDAAITMAAVLAVVRPHMNGVGGDAFLLIREGSNGRVHALNGSGRAGRAATPAAFRARGLDQVPAAGVLSVTVPGAVRAWADALRRFGTIRLADALAPAIRYAENGFPVSTRLAADIAANRNRVAADPVLRDVFLPGEEPPAPGTLLIQRDLAATLRRIAAVGPDALYVGDVALRIAVFLEAEGGLLSIEDLADHSSTWQQPIWTDYLGYRVGAFPPNTQGVAMLMQMNMAETLDVRALGHNRPAYVRNHAAITRLAFRERASAGGAPPPSGRGGDGDGDTVFLCVIDRNGNAVSLIQSLYSAFGSGRMVPGTGIVLHNRGALFSLDPAHINVVAPRKRTYHTLAPALAVRPDGSLFLLFGTPGSDGQTQTLVQVFHNLVVFGMTPQAAVEAPRWRLFEDGGVLLEPGFGEDVRSELAAAGFGVRLAGTLSSDLGGVQVILVDGTGAIRTGADPRREAYGIAW
jgi:gamma-glutamyltranspeptidase/glutathione hydrolase